MRRGGMSDLAFAIRPAPPSPGPCHATIDFDSAIALMTANTPPLGEERIALADAAGRILARPVLARLDSPRADLAAMDGYAVGGAPTATRFRIVGESFPARPHRGAVGPGEAVRIFTGAPMPPGAARVIVQELAVRQGDEVCVPAVQERRHVRTRGSDFPAGAALLPAGRRLDARAMLVAAAADAATLTVWRRPRVFILATGDELCRPGLAGGALSIPDSLSLALASLAAEWGATISGMALVPDDARAIEAAARTAMARADVLIVTGGASVGDRDFSRESLAALGLDTVFAGVAIKPGKPVWHGHVGNVQVLGLPGNPTAALVTARLFLAPLLCLMTGRPASAALCWRPTPLGGALDAAGNRESFLCGDWDGAVVRATDRQASSSQATLAGSNVLIRRHRDASPVQPGEAAMILDF